VRRALTCPCCAHRVARLLDFEYETDPPILPLRRARACSRCLETRRVEHWLELGMPDHFVTSTTVYEPFDKSERVTYRARLPREPRSTSG
jgi:transcriptional regulator NrdR family protein